MIVADLATPFVDLVAFQSNEPNVPNSDQKCECSRGMAPSHGWVGSAIWPPRSHPLEGSARPGITCSSITDCSNPARLKARRASSHVVTRAHSPTDGLTVSVGDVPSFGRCCGRKANHPSRTYGATANAIRTPTCRFMALYLSRKPDRTMASCSCSPFFTRPALQETFLNTRALRRGYSAAHDPLRDLLDACDAVEKQPDLHARRWIG